MENQITQQMAAEHKASLAHIMLSGEHATLEDLFRELLRPMLKAWIEDNLPSIVERLIRAEIVRVKR